MAKATGIISNRVIIFKVFAIEFEPDACYHSMNDYKSLNKLIMFK